MIKTVTNDGVIFNTPLATFFLDNEQLDKLQNWTENNVRAIMENPDSTTEIQVGNYDVYARVCWYGDSVNYVIKKFQGVLANVTIRYDMLFKKENMDD